MGCNELTRKLNGVCIGPGEVLHLDQTSSESPGPVGAVELQQPPHSPIRADAGLDGVVLLRAGLAQLLPYLQHPVCLGIHRIVAVIQDPRHGILAQICKPAPGAIIDPVHELRDAVRIAQT